MGHAYAYAVLDRERHTVTCSRCDYAETAPHAYADGTCIYSRRRNVLAPGEMETVNLKSKLLLDCPDANDITVKLEDA